MSSCSASGTGGARSSRVTRRGLNFDGSDVLVSYRVDFLRNRGGLSEDASPKRATSTFFINHTMDGCYCV